MFKTMRFLFAFCLSLLFLTDLSAQKVYNVMDYGAKGNGLTDDAFAIQKAINQCCQEGGGRVLFPRNRVFMAGPVEIKSNVELYLEATSEYT